MAVTAQDAAERTERGRRRLLLLTGGIALITAALVLLLFGGGWLHSFQKQTAAPDLVQIPALSASQTDSAAAAQNILLETGDTAPNFTLKDIDGRTHELTAYRGQPVIINFWATWCGPCRVEMPELQSAFQQYQQDGLVILAIDFKESTAVVRDFFEEEMGLTFTALLDEDGSVTERYGVFNFPSSYFVDRSGTISAIHRGPLTKGQIEDLLQGILPQT